MGNSIIRLFQIKVAALLVVYSHSYPLTGNDIEPFSLISNGQWTLGGIVVGTFFIISGFLISNSFEKSLSIKQFALNRPFRLFPGIVCAKRLSACFLGPLVTSLPFKEYIKN